MELVERAVAHGCLGTLVKVLYGRLSLWLVLAK
jgi:hypothetical protein